MNIRRLDLHDSPTAQRLLDIQQAAYAVEAALIGSSDIPPLKETLTKLQNSAEIFYGCFVEDQLVGAISYQLDGDTLDIYRMMVHPDHFRRGIANALIEFVQKLHPEIERYIVATGAQNEPAKQLYRRHGFTEIAEKEVQPGLVITFFEKWLR
jgi:ribosomal protein S18 acetylase RimI-like enzyme